MNLYSVEFGGVHSNTVDGPKKTDLSFKKNSDTIVLTLAGIDLDLTMQDASAQLLHVVKADIESVVATNFTLQVELFTTTTDQVHWALGGHSWFHLDNLNITMKQHRWNDMLATMHTPMMNGINYFISYWVPRWISTKVKHFNAKVANEGPMTFMSKILGKNKPLNTTMTKYPQFRSSDQMIEIHMDGRFLDVATQTIDVTPNAIWQPRENLAQKEQFFIHESTVNSLLFSISDTFMPKMISSASLGAQLA